MVRPDLPRPSSISRSCRRIRSVASGSRAALAVSASMLRQAHFPSAELSTNLFPCSFIVALDFVFLPFSSDNGGRLGWFGRLGLDGCLARLDLARFQNAVECLCDLRLIQFEVDFRFRQGIQGAGRVIRRLIIGNLRFLVRTVACGDPHDDKPRPSFFAASRSGGSSFSDMKSECRKLRLTRRTATLALPSAPVISARHLAPMLIFVSSQISILRLRVRGFNVIKSSSSQRLSRWL